MQHIIVSFTGCWISPSPLPLALDAEFTETADQNILTRCDPNFDNLKQGLHNLRGLVEGIKIFRGHHSAWMRGRSGYPKDFHEFSDNY